MPGRIEALYNLAQENEIFVLLRYLPKIAARLSAEHTLWRGEGRPPRDLFDVLVSLGLWHHIGWSSRRAKGMLELLCAFSRIPIQVPSFKTLCRWRGDPRLKPYLDALVTETAKPLAVLEHDFSTDASGASTRNFSTWFSLRCRRRIRHRDHITAHVTTGARSNVAAAVDIDAQKGRDSEYLRSHIARIRENFLIANWCGDSAYLSRANCDAVAAVGALPWFKPKKNTRIPRRSLKTWGRMLRAFHDHPEFAMSRYHKRSNSESTFSAKKRKFGAAVRSRTAIAQENEEHLKWIAYNFSVLARARFELGIKPKLE